MKVFVIMLLLSIMTGVIISRKSITIEISDLKALEKDLLVNGMDSRAVEILYSAAGCSLKRNLELNSKIDQLLNPIEKLHNSVNKMLNKVMKLKDHEDLQKNEETLELIVRHVMSNDNVSKSGKAVVESDHNQVIEQVTQSSNEAEYLPMESNTMVVDPEICRTHSVVMDLIQQSRERRHQVLRIAKDKYRYSGPGSISGLARFYSDYVAKYYDERVKVMGLAKLLGDFSTIVSETYFLEHAFLPHREQCGLAIPSVRRKRNVMQSMISDGVCQRDMGVYNEYYANITYLRKVPFRDTLKSGALSNLMPCVDSSPVWNGIVEKAKYTAALTASFTDGVGVCVRTLGCPPGFVISGTNCIKSSNIEYFTDVHDIEMSVVTSRVRIPEVPDELKTLSKRYCSIQGKTLSRTAECERPIRSTEKFTVFHAAGRWFVTDRDVLIAHGQDITNICFYKCSIGCEDCRQCRGDETYESIFGKWPNSNCTCKYCEDCSDLYMQIGMAKVGVNMVFHVDWPVTIPVESEEKVDCSSCKVSCDGRTLKVERDSKFDILHLCVAESCLIIDESQTDFHYKLPSELLHVTEFKLMFFRSDGKGKFSSSVTCLDSHSCKAIQCDVCTERFANPHCYKLINWIILILIVSALILLVPILYILYKLAKLILMVILIPLKVLYRFSRVVFKKCTKNSKSMAMSTSNRLNKFMDDEEVEFKKVRKMDPFQVSLALIVIILPAALGCENSLSIDSKVLTCLPSSGNEIKCAVNTIIEVPLSSIGEESCINLSDQANNVIQVVKVRTVAIRQKCSKTILYYTNDGEIRLKNVFRCRNAGDCVDDVCERIKESGPVPVPSIDETKAGFHGCSRVTGFWGKGCFYASQACQFYKIELQNEKRRSYEVSKCSEWFWEVKMNMTVSDKNGIREEEITLDTTLPTKTLTGVIQLISINTPMTSLTNKCFLRKLSGNMLTAIVDCSDRSSPIVGKIGGVQCATPALAEKASKSCMLDPNSLQLMVQDDNVAVVSKLLNTTSEWENNLLPNNLTASVVSEDSNGQIFLHHSGQASYNVRMRFSDYKISYTIVQATCEAHFRKLNGCANCGPGAVLSLEVVLNNAARSPVIVKCPSSTSTGVELAVASKPEINFKMTFMEAEISEKCSVTCPGNTVEVEIKGTLIGNIKIRKREGATFLTKGSDFFASIPWTNFGFLRYLYILIGVLLVIPIFYVMYLCFLRCLKAMLSRCSVRKGSKKH